MEQNKLYKQMYILFDTIEEWQQMVAAINLIRNYPNIDGGTYNYIVEPLRSQETYVKDKDGKDTSVIETESKYILPIAADLQENHAELFKEHKLVETYKQIIKQND